MKNKEIAVTPTITAGIYAAGDAVGGLLTFAAAASVYKGEGDITKLVIIDDAMQDAILDLWLFSETFTPTADNAPFDPSDADLQNCIGCLHIAAADYEDGVDNSVATLECEFAFTLAASGTSLFGQLVSPTDTPTYAAVDDLTVKITVRR